MIINLISLFLSCGWRELDTKVGCTYLESVFIEEIEEKKYCDEETQEEKYSHYNWELRRDVEDVEYIKMGSIFPYICITKAPSLAVLEARGAIVARH